MKRPKEWMVLAAGFLCLVGVLCSLPKVDRADAAYREANRPHILIDPGHGGADGGATGADGTQEKDVNLSVSRTLSALFHILGYDVTMTRETDCSIHSPEVTSLREQKVSDMHNRLALYQQATLVVSIHQNQFSQSKYSGAQVFYAPGHPESQEAAALIREEILRLLQPENTRELKRADKALYLMANTTVPTVLVECGFLSNPEECRKLADPEYQRQMAFAVAAGVMRFYDGGAPAPAE